MVSHHPGWNDVEDGYRRRTTGVFVGPATCRDSTAHSVTVRTNVGEPEETVDEVARFADLRDAWTFANLLTHFFEARTVPTFARHDLIADRGPLAPPTVIADRAPTEAFLALLSPAPVPVSVRHALSTTA
ncbi:hypothetical protein QA599_15160 [Haloarculaceae archaeon H-GB1-1]|nr:hypothetical protein [Haloarculaceae archaeon H-GB1-1]